MLDEEGMPGIFADHPSRQPVGGVGAAMEILDMEVLEPRMGHEVLAQRLEMAPAHGPVVVPPDRFLGEGVADDELVGGASSGVAAGRDDESAAFSHLRLAAGHGLLVEGRRRRIPADPAHPAQAKVGELGPNQIVGGGVHGVISLEPRRRLGAGSGLLKANDVLKIRFAQIIAVSNIIF